MNMIEEKNLTEELKRMATNPYRVPEGYFESLPSRIMERVDASQPPVVARRLWLRPVVRWAAVFIGVLVVSVASWHLFGGDQSSTQSQQSLMVTADDEAFYEAADYALLDNQDIYTYLADN